MANIENIEKNTPHACISGPSGNVHVISVRAIDNIVDGKLCLHDVDEDLIRGIIKDWLVRAKID